MLNIVAIVVAFWPCQQPVQAAPEPPTGAQQAVQELKSSGQTPAEPKPAEQAPGTPPAGQDKEKEKAAEAKPGDAKQEDPAAAEPKPDRLQPIKLTLGFSDWNLSGNQNKFRQFGTPSKSFFVRDFLFAPLPSLRDTGYFSARGPGESDHRFDARVALFNGRTQAELWQWRSEFLEPVPAFIAESRRRVEEESFKQILSQGISLSMRYRMINQNQLYEPPLNPLHQRTRYWDTILSGTLGNGQVRLGYTDWRYFDRTLTLFDTSVTGWRLGYMWTPLRDVGIEAAYSNMDIKQSGQPTGRVDYVSLTGDASISPTTDLGLLLRQDHLRLPVVKTAYAREQRLAQISLGQSIGKWNAKLSLSQRDVERVRTDQTFVDVPKWVTFDGRLDGRISRNLRMTLRGYTQSISDIPPMNSVDPRSMYWSSRDFVQLRFQHSNGEVNSYFVFTHRNWDNDARSVNLTQDSFVVGGRWEVTPRLSMFVDYTKDNWDGHSEVTTFPTLRNFLPDSHVIAAGLDWMIDSRAFFSVNVTNFGTNNENPLLLRDGNTSGLFFSINTRYLFPSGDEIGLTVAPWTYRDDVQSVMNYDAAVVMLTGKVRF